MAVPVTVKVSAFALAVMGSYSWYANSIPQIESKPPEELSLEGGNVTPAQLVAAGEKIFREKGQCTTCHGIGRAGRGPDLAGVGARAGTRKPGTKASAYLVESLLNPSAYVVEGFPNIMPNVSKPPIGLNRSELWAIAAYLESLGGTVDVKLDDVPQVAAAQAEVARRRSSSPAIRRRARRSSRARAPASRVTRRARSAPAPSARTCRTSRAARPRSTSWARSWIRRRRAPCPGSRRT